MLYVKYVINYNGRGLLYYFTAATTLTEESERNESDNSQWQKNRAEDSR